MYFKVVFNRRGIDASKKMSEARIELAIFGFVDRRNIHYATRPCCIHGKFSSLAAQCSALPILNSEIRVQKKVLKNFCETLNF